MSRGMAVLALMMRLSVGLAGAAQPLLAAEAFAGAGLVEHPGTRLPDGLPLTDEHGLPTTLGQLRAGQPLVLVPAYYRCPLLCGLVIRGVAQAVAELGWQPDQRFRLLTVSFEPSDAPADAARAQATAVALIAARRGGAAVDWPFTVATPAAVATLLGTIGMRISRDPASGQIAHPAVVVVVGADGRISRYLMGLGVQARDLRLALLDAGANRTATVGDDALLFCYHYDPAHHRYGLAVQDGMRAGAIGSALLAALVVVRCSRRRIPSGPGAAP